MPRLKGKIASSVVKYRGISQRISFKRNCLKHLHMNLHYSKCDAFTAFAFWHRVRMWAQIWFFILCIEQNTVNDNKVQKGKCGGFSVWLMIFVGKPVQYMFVKQQCFRCALLLFIKWLRNSLISGRALPLNPLHPTYFFTWHVTAINFTHQSGSLIV